MTQIVSTISIAFSLKDLIVILSIYHTKRINNHSNETHHNGLKRDTQLSNIHNNGLNYDTEHNDNQKKTHNCIPQHNKKRHYDNR